jgi:hypothetical protein
MKKIAVLAICAITFAVQAAVKPGAYYGSAASISVGGTKTVTLVTEYDPWDKSYSEDDGAYYLKFTAKRGESYTVYTTGMSEDMSMDISDVSSYVEKDVSCPGFFVDMEYDDVNMRGLLDASDWDEEDTASVVFYIYISGEIGSTATVHLSNSYTPATEPYGISDEKPLVLSTPTTSVITRTSDAFIGGTFYYAVTLDKTKRYKFGTTGGTADDSFSISIYGAEGVETPDYTELAEWTDDGNEGYVVKPVQDGKVIICVAGEAGRFGFRYCQVPARLPGAHVNVDGSALTALTPSATEAVRECLPGYRNHPASGYVDDYIDEQLYKVTLTAGALYRFATEGAQTNLVMELYNAAGDTLLRNRGTAGYDCLIAFAPETSGDYWVGVCEAAFAEETDEDVLQPTYPPISFTAKRVTDDDAKLSDERDPMDDTYTGATALDPAPGLAGDDVLVKGAKTGHHTLGLDDFVDTFRIDATKGLSYKIRVQQCCAIPSECAPTCMAQVVTYDANGMATTVKTIDNLEAGGVFTADADTSYYIVVSLKDGQGVDFGPYELYSLMYDTQGRTLGKLSVEIGGATFAEGATWSIAGYGTYPGGAFKWLPVGTYTITFAQNVPNWNTPANVQKTVEGGKTVTVSVKYTDVFDASSAAKDATEGDGSKNGAKVQTLVASTTTARTSHSLWESDKADWFKLPVVACGYYALALEASEKTTNTVMTVYRANGIDVVADVEVGDGRKGGALEFFSRETGDYWVCVKHLTAAAEDSQYTLAYSARKVGAVQFEKSSYSVKDTAFEVTLAVARTGGSDGVIRARYTTRGGTAVAGAHYVNATGVLEWGDGDTEAKTITVKLIPDLVAKWQEDREFAVEVSALDPMDVRYGEYMPGVGAANVAEVTILEATKKACGTVRFAAYGSAMAKEAFANISKPAVQVSAGEAVTLWLERVGGVDGEIAVTVAPTKGTAQPDVNYEALAQTVAWADGDDAPKAFVLRTLDTGTAYQTPKSMTVKLTADRTYPDRAKTGPAVSVTIFDPDLTDTFETYAVAAKSDGLTLKAGSQDTWYFDASGLLRCVTPSAGGTSSLTLSLTGPGRLTFAPSFVGDGAAVFACKVDGEEVACGDGSNVVRYLGKGRHTVTFAVTGGAALAAGEEAFVSFGGQTGGTPFAWKPLNAPTLLSPLQNSVVLAESAHFLVDGDADADVRYMIYIDPDKANLGTEKAYISSADPEIGEIYPHVSLAELSEYCPACSIKGLPPGEMLYWRVDAALLDENGAVALVNTNSAVWVFKTAPSGDAVGQVKVAYGQDGNGASVLDTAMIGTVQPVSLVQGVNAEIGLGAVHAQEAAFSLVAGSRLPTGMKLKNGVISGVPTVAGEFLAAVQVKDGCSLGFRFTVRPMGLLAGTFNGILVSDDERLTSGAGNRVPADVSKSIGSLKVTAAENGKLTARVGVGGSTYTFTKTGYDFCVEMGENGLPSAQATFARVVKLTVEGMRHTCTNTLVLTACAGETNDWTALDTPMRATMTLSTVSVDKTVALTNVLYSGEAVRKNTKLEETKAAFADWTGYYTVALPPKNAFDGGVPQGNGYLTMTITDGGKAKVAAVLADGSTFSCSANVAYLSENEYGERELRFPVFNTQGKAVFGGWIRLKQNDLDMPVVRADSDVRWVNGDFKSTRNGNEGFALEIEPTGGWYNTVWNLQAYYLNSELLVRGLDEWSLPTELLGETLTEFVSYPGIIPEYLDIRGNTMSAENASPSDLVFTLRRATGLFNGSFSIWGSDGSETATKIGIYSHRGVLLLSADEDAAELPMKALYGNAVAAGFCTLPVKLPSATGGTRTWKCSLPFLIEAIDVIHDWSEGLPVDVNGDEDDE